MYKSDQTFYEEESKRGERLVTIIEKKMNNTVDIFSRDSYEASPTTHSPCFALSCLVCLTIHRYYITYKMQFEAP